MKAPHADKFAEFLTQEEEQRLAEALPDHFVVYGGLMPGTLYRLSDLGFEPFFGVAAGSLGRGDSEFLDPKSELLADG